MVVSQVYPPDPAAVGQHLADVAEEMVRRGWSVAVYTASRGYDDPNLRYASRERRQGVDVRRLSLSSFGKRSLAVRLLAQLLFLAQVLPRLLLCRRLSCLLVSTSPPFAGFFGAVVAAIRRAPLVWWVMDVNPDQLVSVGRISATSWLVTAFDWMNRQSLRAARQVIVLDQHMKAVIQRKASATVTMAVIPPWAGAEEAGNLAVADDPETNMLRRQLGCGSRVVVMYSGNHAITSPLGTLLEAIRCLGDTTEFAFVFIGGGSGKADVEKLIAEYPELPVHSLPYQPRELLGDSLAAADVHVVSLADYAVGLVHPCKLYGAMAVGRAVIALAPAGSYLGAIVDRHGIGWRVSHGDVAGMIAVLQEISRAGRTRLRQIGTLAREVAASEFSKTRSVAAVCDILEQKVEEPRDGTSRILPTASVQGEILT